MSRANENRQKAHNVKKEVVRNVCNHLLAGPEKKWSGSGPAARQNES